MKLSIKAIKIITATLVSIMILTFAAYSLITHSVIKGNKSIQTKSSISDLISAEPTNTEDALNMYQQLTEKENEILSTNQDLWEKVFSAADKNNPMIEDGTNYGDFLLYTIENAKDLFTADELKTLTADAEQIKKIRGKMTILEQKYPECTAITDTGSSVPANEANIVTDIGELTKFPSFDGKDLDDNDVKSGELFSKNKVTVINFWFTSCNPCVGELSNLEELNKKLNEKGGEVIGINSFTIDGDKSAIAEAKELLSKKGITYKNIWFDSKSEAGKFTSGIYSYPTTYVIDRNGNIVGEPIVGAITEKKQAKVLEEQIEQAISNSNE